MIREYTQDTKVEYKFLNDAYDLAFLKKNGTRSDACHSECFTLKLISLKKKVMNKP